MIYTASSDRTVKLWDGKDVRSPSLISSSPLRRTDPLLLQGKLIRTLSEHAHWVNTMALNTDFVLRTGPFDQHGKFPATDEEGTPLPLLSSTVSFKC